MAMCAKGRYTAFLYVPIAICSLSERAIKRWVTQELEQGRLSMATHGRIPRGGGPGEVGFILYSFFSFRFYIRIGTKYRFFTIKILF